MFFVFFRLLLLILKVVKVVRVSNLLNQFGLLRVVNIIIGDEGCWGVLGGERCCVLIGIDIVYDLFIFFLDEFMLGLDFMSVYLVVS